MFAYGGDDYPRSSCDRIEDTVVLVTGATDGLGRGVARDLASPRRARAAPRPRPREARRAERGARRRARRSRPTSPRSTRCARLAADVEAETPALHVLINNAGIGSGRPDGTTRQESRDGYELRLAVNHLAGFLLTLRLLPLLRRSAPARIVHVASLGQAPMDFDDPMLERGYSGTRAYGQSKLAQITAGFELAERLDPAEVTVTSLHPSTYMPTKMVLEERGSAVDTLEAGVAATVRLAVDPALEGVTGRFYDRQRGDDARPAGERPRGPPAPVGALARAHRRARARALGRAPAPGSSARKRSNSATSPSSSTSSSGRSCQSAAASGAGVGQDRARPGPRRSRAATTNVPPRTSQREAVLAQPQVDHRPRTRRAASNSVLSAITNASTPRSASPPGNGARLPQRPRPMTSGSSSCPHSVSS